MMLLMIKAAIVVFLILPMIVLIGAFLLCACYLQVQDEIKEGAKSHGQA